MATPSPGREAPQRDDDDQQGAQVLPSISTLVKWGAKHPVAPTLGLMAAAAVLVQFVRDGATGREGLVWALVAIAAVVGFVWAFWLLQNYRTAPAPVKVLAWSLCISGGLVFVAAAVTFILGWKRIPDWRLRDLHGCTEDASWFSRDEYSKLFNERKNDLYPARVFAREMSPGEYSFCAVWLPSPRRYETRSWQTPSQFAATHQARSSEGYRLVSMDSLTTSDNEVYLQATWLGPSSPLPPSESPDATAR